MRNLLEIYEEADANDVMILEHKIGDRKSIIAHAQDTTAIAVNSKLIETTAEEKQ